MHITLGSIKAFCFLANPHRETFVQFVNRFDGKRPQYYVSRYLIENGATGESLDLLKDSDLLNKIHGNYKKTTLLNAPGQAILEATILVSMIQQIVECENTAQFERYLDFSEVCVLRIKKELELLPLELFDNMPIEYGVISSLDSSIEEYMLKEKTIKHILDLWNHKPISIHDISYEYYRGKIDA